MHMNTHMPNAHAHAHAHAHAPRAHMHTHTHTHAHVHIFGTSRKVKSSFAHTQRAARKGISICLVLLHLLAFVWQPKSGVKTIDDLHPVLAPLLLNVQQYVSDTSTIRDLDSVEFMSGKAEITRAHGQMGARCIGFDKSYSDWSGCDISTGTGFDRAMGFAL